MSKPVTYRCQECGHTFKTTLEAVVRAKVRCGECGTTNELSGGVPSSYHSIIRDVNDGLESSRSFTGGIYSRRFGGRRFPVSGGTSGGIGRVRGLHDSN